MRRLTFERTAVAVLLLLVFMLAAVPAVDNDLWWHIRTGQWIADRHAIPGADPFNHTRPEVVRVATDWLSQLGLNGLWHLGGRPLIAIVVALLITAGVGVVYLNTEGPLFVRVGTTALAATAAAYFWAARPQIVTFVSSALVLLITRRWRRSPGRFWLWWLVPIFAVWVNFHGAVVYGFMVLGAVVVGDRGNALVARYHPFGIKGVAPMDLRAWLTTVFVSMTCIGVVSLNPSGMRVYGLAFHQAATSLKYIQEVQPPTFEGAFGFYLMLILTVVTMLVRWRDIDMVDLLLVGGVGLFALRVGRVVSFFAEAAAPPLSRQLSSILEGRGIGREARRELRPTNPGLNAVVITLAALTMIVGVSVKLSPARVEAGEREAFPVDAVSWMNRTRPPPRLFNTFDWGGYVLLFAPDYRVSVDGRTDVYDAYLDTYADVVTAKTGWQAELNREGINTVLIDRPAPLAKALRSEPGWHLAYEDSVSAIFVRDALIDPPRDGVDSRPG